MEKKIEHGIKRALKNKVVLITGGAGSIGSALTKRILEFPVHSVRVLDMDEYSLFKLGKTIDDTRLRLLLGNILDKDRIEMASTNVDIIIHAAAIKNIEISEFNPIETVDVNINGVVNLLKTCIRIKPSKFINISTDKVAEPTTLYGATKQLGERLTSWAGAHIQTTTFASIRLGNIMESRGNVFETWSEELKNNQPLSITNPKMQRFYFHVDEAVDFILKCIFVMKQGEILIPKMKSYNIVDLAKKYSKKHRIIGLRQGEKLNEVLITEQEKKIANETNDMWTIKLYEHGKYLLS